MAVLVNGSVVVAPLAGDLYVGLVREEWRESLYSAVDGDVVDLDPTLAEQLFDSRYESQYRRYQPTAKAMVSGGNRKPLNAELGTTAAGRERRRLPTAVMTGSSAEVGELALWLRR